MVSHIQSVIAITIFQVQHLLYGPCNLLSRLSAYECIASFQAPLILEVHGLIFDYPIYYCYRFIIYLEKLALDPEQ